MTARTADLADDPGTGKTVVWGVEVNELKVHTYTGSDPDWWVWWRIRMERTGRIVILHALIPGDVVHVACDSKDDAVELMAMFVERGIHKSALKVCRRREVAG